MEHPLRFCMITTYYPPYNFGGDGIFVHRLSNELARRGNLVDVIHCVDAYRLAAPAPSTGYRDHPNVTVHGLKSRLGRLSPLATQQTGFPLMKSRRIQAILSKGFDVIHYHNISLVGGPAVLGLGKAIKLYTMHDYWLICPTHALFRFNRAPCRRPTGCAACSLVYKRPPQLWRYSGLLEAATKNIDAFIAPSLTSQRKHEQLGHKGRIVFLPNFVSIDTDNSALARPDYQEQQQRYFLFVGRLEKLKGLHTLLPAFVRQSKAQLWIAGTGSEEHVLRELAHGNSKIRFLGHQSASALRVLYRNAVALLYPSINFQVGLPRFSPGSTESAPLVIMEAFSQKTPVIATNVGRIPGLLERTGGGLAYSTEQELLAVMDRLLSDPARRSELGARAYEAYRAHWTAEAHLSRYIQLIEEISASRRGPAGFKGFP
ncbi:MAG TPA: glycosyltransferase family 4 protein [Bryobacteraceae bacterium]|nr:glycosyltransferase family 4 protein [Bryobacteraceae bacterium]